MRLVTLTLVVACGGSPLSPDGPTPLVPTANLEREILDTKLSFDVTATTGTARITFAASDTPGATLEIGELTIGNVTIQGDVPVEFQINAEDAAAKNATGATMDLAIAPSLEPVEVAIDFTYRAHAGGFTGASSRGYTFLWPYFCGNLFPCHSSPEDGTAMSLELSGIPDGKTAVFPPTISEAPSYQLAWTIDTYTELPLGTTTAGTQVSVWHLANEATIATNGTRNLVAVFDWLEKTLGPYRFGNKVGSVSVRWGAGAYGGMEHHPLWHVGAASLGSEETHAHEAAHGWYGDGIRLACWEDFVLSEGTVTYLAGRALEVVAPSVGADVWASYATDLAGIPGTDKVWPKSCNAVDMIDDDLFTTAPYIRGAFFYRGVAQKIGASELDAILAAFYAQHAGKAASMADMLALIQSMSGYDATACADTWLSSTTTPTPAPCP
ncbi:MAG: M1 family aminopeptidase [Kofleriaceae bacterium]